MALIQFEDYYSQTVIWVNPSTVTCVTAAFDDGSRISFIGTQSPNGAQGIYVKGTAGVTVQRLAVGMRTPDERVAVLRDQLGLNG